MATLFIQEYAGQGAVDRGEASTMGQEPAYTSQTVTITGASAPSAAFGPNTTMVRLVADASCSIVFGATPVASATSMFLPANQPQYFGVVPKQKVAVIANS